jgi:hypothetical protein
MLLPLSPLCPPAGRRKGGGDGLWIIPQRDDMNIHVDAKGKKKLYNSFSF